MAVFSPSQHFSSLTSLSEAIASFDFKMSAFSVKVDRKVLSDMLNGSDPSLETANDFFVRVSNESGAIVEFPNKKRLELMKRKEPEIMIVGKPHQILLAQKLIIEAMNPNRNRVTLKIDVSHTEHSHIIGKGGKRIQSIMDLTATHIHFPDENRTDSLQKSNLVTITGNSAQNVEEARLMIRQSVPFTVSFQIDINDGNIGLLDRNHPNIQYFQNQYNVMITFKTLESTPLSPKTAIVQLRGTRLHLQQLLEGTRALYQHLNWSLVGFNSAIITISLEISPQNHYFVMGRNSCNLKAINSHTGAQVSFPNQDMGSPSIGSSTVIIRGRGFESAVLGLIELLGYLPIMLVFEVKPQDLKQEVINSLIANPLVTIKVFPKAGSNNKTVLIKTEERHTNLLFNARKRILNLDEDSPQDLLKPIPPAILPRLSDSESKGVKDSTRMKFPFKAITLGSPEVIRSFEVLFKKEQNLSYI